MLGYNRTLMIPVSAIIEIVCNSCGVTPKEFNTTTRQHRILYCQHHVILAILNNTRLSVHQVSELMQYDLQRVTNARYKLNRCVVGGTFETKYREITLDIKQYENKRMYKSYIDNSDTVPVIPLHDIVQYANVCG